MYKKILDDTFFPVKKVSCFAEINKTTKIFSGYAIANIGSNQIISQVTDGYQFISNEDLCDNVIAITGLRPREVYGDGKWFFYYTETKAINEVTYSYEVVNSYDGHIVKQCNLIYNFNDLTLFTGVPSFENIEDRKKIRKTNFLEPSDIWKSLEKKKNSAYRSLPYPKRYSLYYPPPSLIEGKHHSATAVLTNHLLLINEWKKTNFLKAREYSIYLFKHYFNLLHKEDL